MSPSMKQTWVFQRNFVQGAVGKFGNVGFNISKQRVSKLSKQKAGSLIYYQTFLVYPGFLEPSFSMEFLLKYFCYFPFPTDKLIYISIDDSPKDSDQSAGK